MRQILQQAVVPALRDLQFRGTMPHFFRQRGERVDLMSIQFSYQGQHFFVNLGRLELARDAAGQVSKPTKEQLNVANSPLDQRVRLAVGTMPQRLGGATFPGFDAWDFTAETDTEADALMQRLAHRLCEFLKSYADPWWRDKELRGDLPPRNVGP